MSDTTEDIAILGDVAAGFVAAYRKAAEKVRDYVEIRDALAKQIQMSLGDAEVGVFHDKPVVRWTRYTTRRLDKDRVAAHLTPEQLSECYTSTEARRFTVVDL